MRRPTVLLIIALALVVAAPGLAATRPPEKLVLRVPATVVAGEAFAVKVRVLHPRRPRAIADFAATATLSVPTGGGEPTVTVREMRRTGRTVLRIFFISNGDVPDAAISIDVAGTLRGVPFDLTGGSTLVLAPAP